MSKKNKTDFIDEEEFLSAVSQNKKGGCVRMGKPPQETDEPPQTIEPPDEALSAAPIVQEPRNLTPKAKEGSEKKKAERQRGQNGTLVRLKSSKENMQRMSAYIRIDNHRRFSVAAGVYKTTIGQMVDAILDEWWEKNRDEVKGLYYQDREVFEDC